VLEQFALEPSGKRIGLTQGNVAIHRHVQLDIEPMTQPAGPHIQDLTDAWDVPGGMSDFCGDFWLDPVQHASENGLG